MTVSAQITFVEYAGAGLTGPYTIPFSFTSDADVVVKKTVSGTTTTLTGNTITGAGEATGGSLTTAAVVAVGETLLIYRATPWTQPADYTASDSFPAETHEGALDRLTRIAQDQARDIGRTIRVPMGDAGLELDPGSDGVLTLEDGALVLTPLEDIAGEKGDKGDPGAGGTAVGAFLDISALSIPAGTNRILATGYTEEHDCPSFWLIDVTGDAVTLASDTTSNDGDRDWRIAGDQILRPEFCGAVGDAVLEPNTYEAFDGRIFTTNDVTGTPTDDTAAFVKFYDLLNYWHSFDAALSRNYWLDHVTRVSIGYTTKNVTLHDGRTCSGKFINTVETVPLAVCWDGFTFDCTGAKIILNGDFNLQAADYLAGTIYRLKDTLLPFNLWKCRNGRFINVSVDGGWRFQTTDTAAAGECLSYAVNISAGANLTFENLIAFDMAQDGVAIGHRNLNVNPITGAVLVNTEGYPEPDQSTASVYDPDGRSQNITFINPVIGPCRRQGMSPIGVGGRDLAQRYPGLTVIGGLTFDIGRYMGAAPKWLVGDVTDGSIKWQYRGFPPRLAFDFEPQRAGPYQADGVKIIGHRMEGCVGGFVGSPGDWGLNRVEQSVAAADVNAATNVFTKTALTLPGCYLGQIPCKVRIWSDGTLPGGLAAYTDYFLAKLSATTFYVCRTYEDAVAVPPVPIDISSAGSGTHWFVYFDSHPNVGTIDLIDCTGVHPADGSLAPFQVTSERFTISGGVYENRAGTGYFGPSQSNREYTVWQGVEFRSVRYLVDIDSYQPKSGATFESAGEDVTYADHGIGKYEYTPVRFKSTGTLPVEVVRNRTYYAARVSDNVFQIAASIPDAEAGTFVTFSSAGTGTHSWWKFNKSKFSITGNRFIHAPRDMSFHAIDDVDTTNNRIRIPSFKVTQDSMSLAEPFRLRYANENVTGAVPGGLTAESTTYYAITDPNEPEWVQFASSSANANTRTAIDLTSVGDDLRLVWAPTNSIKAGDIADVDCDFEGNKILIGREAMQGFGDTQTVWSIIGASSVGGNSFETDLRDTEGFMRAYYADNRTIVRPDHFWPPEVFAATNVSSSVNFASPQIFTFTGTLNPTSIAAGVVENFTVSVPGLLTTDRCIVEMQISGSFPSVVVQRAFCATNGTLTIALANVDSSGAAADLASTAFTLLGVRIG